MNVLTPKVEIYGLDGAAAWADVSADVVSDVRCTWGIHGWQPKDRVADPGNATFDLDNNTTNSGAVRGYYTLGHGSVREGFANGVLVRISVVHTFFGTRVVWVGTIDKADPVPGVSDPRTKVACVDWMDDAARSKLSGLAAETNVQSDELFTILTAAMDKQPPGGTQYGSGSDIYPYALDNTQDEKSKVIEELQKLAMSEYGLVYLSAGVLIFEGRRRRSGIGSAALAFDENNMVGLTLTNGRDDVLNRIQVSVHPRRVDTVNTVLFRLANTVQILRGASVTISCPYRDQNQQAQRIGGTSMVTPVAPPPPAGTDYLFNTLADGTGTVITGQLAVVVTFGGNTAVATITNNGPQDGYIPAQGFQLRGIGLYDFEPVISDARDQASIEVVGENPLGYDMPYQSSVDNARDMASFILSLNKDSRLRPKTVTWVANWDDTLTAFFFGGEISSRVSITSAAMGLDASLCYINGYNVSISKAGVCRITCDLAPVDTTAFWLLEVDGFTELDETTVLGYGLFVAGWLLDTSVLGTDTFLN